MTTESKQGNDKRIDVKVANHGYNVYQLEQDFNFGVHEKMSLAIFQKITITSVPLYINISTVTTT